MAAFPAWLREFTEAVAHTIQAPIDLAGSLALATLSTAAGGRVMVRVRPSWSEQTTIYTVVIMEPSARKSPVFTAMTEPIRALEAALREEAKHSIETARMQQQMAASARENAQKKAATMLGEGADTRAQEEAIADAVDAALEAEAIGIPHPPQLIADDVTPPKVATMLAQQNGRLSVLSDEGTVFEIVAGRYSGNVQAEVFLKRYSGTELRVDRGDRSEYVPRPALTLGVTIQPAVIEDLPKKLRGNGFFARILFSQPVPMSGHRIIRPGPIPQEAADTYHRNMLTIARELHGFDDPITLTFSPEADDLMADIEREIEPKLDPLTGSLANIADWSGKLAGQTARIAALLHLAEHPLNAWNNPTIERDTLANAWEIAKYYTTHAQATLAKIGAPPSVAVAQRCWTRSPPAAGHTATDSRPARSTTPSAAKPYPP
ncbi:YfjI family protein [Amycolatopsis carbonis]|uniref:YfjI family protein n=1 Tax=Amycolatopsis carbonis TaxID=715471 RepID=A0A9Y2IME6_9PSEU|nr:YfjI family protein [Amycolatopsis sp. 2-15]WIX81681.1 YfjI family protein [Amycolatopsis sp. 2-15]